jgi:hypothetical protein
MDLANVPGGLYHLEVLVPGKSAFYSKLLVSKP